MSENFNVIAIFLDGRIVCKTYVFIIINLLSYKNWKQN